jgi:ribosomal protein L31
MKSDVLECFGGFQKCLACKKMQNLWFGINALLRGTEVEKTVSRQMHPFYTIGLKMMFGSGLEHLQSFDM